MFGGSLGQDQAVMELGAMKPLNEIAAAFVQQGSVPVHSVVFQVEH